MECVSEFVEPPFSLEHKQQIGVAAVQRGKALLPGLPGRVDHQQLAICTSFTAWLDGKPAANLSRWCWLSIQHRGTLALQPSFLVLNPLQVAVEISSDPPFMPARLITLNPCAEITQLNRLLLFGVELVVVALIEGAHGVTSLIQFGGVC